MRALVTSLRGAAVAVEQPEGHLGLFAEELTSRSPIPEQNRSMTTASTDTPNIRDCLERIAEYIEPGEIVNLNRVWRTV